MTTFKNYITGFLISIVLTVTAYFTVANHILNSTELVTTIIILALLQLLAQLFFFLHVGKGQDAQWNVIVLVSTVFIILLLVTGSLWIVSHLNHNMTPDQMNTYMMKSEGMEGK